MTWAFPELIFPTFEYKITKSADKLYIFDPIRKKWLLLTPEEWVRQHVLHFLISEKKIPRGLIKLEAAHKTQAGMRRSDIMIVDRTGCIWMVIECKAPSISLTEKSLLQAAHYAGAAKSSYLVLTNGLEVFLAKLYPQPHRIADWPQF